MSDAFEVEIRFDDPDFFKALQDPEGFMPFLASAMQEILTVFEKVASNYAPESEANRPGRFDSEGKPMGYYERGRGWWYPLITHNALGMGSELPTVKPHLKSPKTLSSMSTLAVGFKGVAGYRLVPNSEQMHDKWVWDVIPSNEEVIGNLSNLASYSSYVQGMDQTGLHASRDWQTVMVSWESDEVQKATMDYTIDAIDAYYRLG